MKDEADILFEYTEQAGIVVPFPQKTAQYAQAVVDYANQLETELVKAETEIAKMEAVIEAAERLSLSDDEVILIPGWFVDAVLDYEKWKVKNE